MSSDLDLLIGKWIVKVRPAGRSEPWTWEYEFLRDKTVIWKDLKSPENGSGTWSASAKLLNISWDGSATHESWSRPLTPTPPLSKTWYESSYYRGQYKVEKPACPGFSTDGPFKLATPEEIYQTGLLCWAAGSVSWLSGTKRGNTTVADLLKKYRERGKLDEQNALPEENMKDVFLDIGISLRSVPAVEFTYCYLLEKLKTKGHLVLLSGHVGDSMGHTQVVFGVGDPTNEYFDVFDPLQGQGFKTRRFSELTGNVYVGWAK